MSLIPSGITPSFRYLHSAIARRLATATSADEIRSSPTWHCVQNAILFLRRQAPPADLQIARDMELPADGLSDLVVDPRSAGSVESQEKDDEHHPRSTRRFFRLSGP